MAQRLSCLLCGHFAVIGSVAQDVIDEAIMDHLRQRHALSVNRQLSRHVRTRPNGQSVLESRVQVNLLPISLPQVLVTSTHL